MLETVNPRKLRIPHIYICPSHPNKLIIPTSMQVIQYICVHGAVPRRPEITSQTQSLKTKGKKKVGCGGRRNLHIYPLHGIGKSK
jgi:hypothetical protein